MAFSGAAIAVAFPVFPVLCLSALMTGGATGAAVIALQRHVGRAASNPTQLKQVFGWLSIGPAVSNFIGPFAAGLLIDHAGATAGALTGYRAAFALMALLSLFTWFWVRHARELPPVVPAPGAGISTRRAHRSRPARYRSSSRCRYHSGEYGRGSKSGGTMPMIGGVLMIAASYVISSWLLMSLLCLAVIIAVYQLMKQGY